MSPQSRPPRPEPRNLLLRDGRTLAWAEWGAPDGFPAFYFHGTPGSRLEGALADEAARRHGLRLIAPDRPGYGRSTFHPNRSFRDWPDDIRELAGALGLGEFGAVGHSGAGPHLFACGAFLPPERLRFIGALGPWGPLATPEIQRSLNPLDRFYARIARRIPSVMRLGFAPLAWCAKYSPRLFLALLRTAVPAADRSALAGAGLLGRLRDAELEAFRQGGRGGAYEAMIAYRPWDFDLADVAVPTHIWLGDRDIFVPEVMGRHLRDTIPGVDFHWVEGRGHFAVECWDAILAACLRSCPT